METFRVQMFTRPAGPAGRVGRLTWWTSFATESTEITESTEDGGNPGDGDTAQACATEGAMIPGPLLAVPAQSAVLRDLCVLCGGSLPLLFPACAVVSAGPERPAPPHQRGTAAPRDPGTQPGGGSPAENRVREEAGGIPARSRAVTPLPIPG